MNEQVSKEEAAPVSLIITPEDMRFPLLASQSLPCDLPLSDEDKEVVNNMVKILSDMGSSAVGLAGVQIGLMRRIFVMKRVNGTMLACINPTVLFASRETTNKAEGCLSIPRLYTNVKRPKQITLGYFDVFGSYHEETFFGIDAKVISHEMDHLNGRTISFHAECNHEKAERLEAENKRIKQAKKEKRRRLEKLRRR